MYRKISIVGTGFMGASLAKSIKSRSLCKVVCGLTSSYKRDREIEKLNIFDTVTHKLEEAFEDAELIILALPIDAMVNLIRGDINSYFKKNNNHKSIITDLGSVKKNICLAVNKSSISKRFVGSHPICGSEKSGAINAIETLYQGAKCIVTECSNIDNQNSIKSFWESVGCTVSIMKPDEHDRILSNTSHLPHVISFAYSQFIPKDDMYYSAGAFRDITRMSMSEPSVWNSILINNSEEICKSIDNLTQVLSLIKSKIESHEPIDIAKIKDKITKKL